MMKEIRIHGRGGQGVVTAGELLATAAFEDGLYSQALPSFGTERMGAPVEAYVRLSDTKIRRRTRVDNPDYVIVQDPTLLESVDVTRGLKKGATVLINTEKPIEELGLKADALILAVPAMAIARETIGRPIPNTALVGAFAAATKEISLEAVARSIRHRFPGEAGEKNVQAATRAFEFAKEASSENHP
jgi:pyruvate ferredoxin oxidoreductase gamma subunit